jgi:hypothetical protein
LGDLGPAGLDLLRQASFDLDVEVQVAVIRSIAKVGGAASHELLLEALKSDQLQARVAAAEALSERGGKEVVLPLIDAYHRCFLGRSARRQRRMGPLLLLLVMALAVSFFTLLSSGSPNEAGLFLQMLLSAGAGVFMALRSRDRSGKVLEAILKVAERSPHPELGRLLPELHAVASDRLQYSRGTRDISHLAAQRIESLTAAFKDLPVPAAPTERSPEILPVPAERGGE